MRILALVATLSAALLPTAARASWTVIPGKTISAPAAVWSPDTHKVYVAVAGSANQLYFAAVNPDKTVTIPYVNIAGGRPLTPALLWDPVLHKIDIVVVSSDHHVWFAVLNLDGTLFLNWRDLRGALASPPALVWDPLLKKVDILGRSSDNSMWFATVNSDGALLRKWFRVPGGTPSSPAAAWDPSLQKIQVMVRGANDALWFGTLNSDGSTYKKFTQISGNTRATPSLIFDPVDSRLYAFVRGGDKEVWFTKFDSQAIGNPVWEPISGRLPGAPAVALDPAGGIAYIIASMPNDYASGTFTYVDDFPVSGSDLKKGPATAFVPSPAEKSNVRNMLDSPWWRHFYTFNYADIRARQGAPNPPGFLLESLTKAYAPSYFSRTGGTLVKLWLSTGDFKRAQEVLRYTLAVTKQAGLNRVPHYVLTNGQPDMTDQIDGQASIILSWALYAKAAHDPAFVGATYWQVAALMDASLGPPYINPKFGLVRNSHLEHYREERYWDTYDMLTQSYVAQALVEMIRVAESRGDALHATRWQAAKTTLERAIARKLTWNLDGQRIYAEMYDDKSTSQIFLGLSEFNFGPTAAGWQDVDPQMYNRTIAALARYGSFTWRGHRIIGIGFSKGIDIVPVTAGKLLAWQMLYFAQRGDWEQVGQTLAFIKDEQQRNDQPRVFETSQVKISPTTVDVFNGAGNGEQVVWVLYALHEIAKLAGAKSL